MSVVFASTEILERTLANGLTVIIKEDRTHPVATVLLTLGAGLSAEDNLAGSGVSHFVEHMVFKGSVKRDANQIRQEVKSYGGAINGSTGLDSANYYITLPSEHVKNALLLIEDMVFHPIFERKEIENEREVILKEIRLNQDDPSRKIMRRLWETSFLDHPYKLPVIGYESLFKELKANDLQNYHSLRYVPNNAILTVTGDIDKNKVLDDIKRVFGPLNRKGNSIITLPVEPEQNSVRQSKDRDEINLAYLAISYHTVEASSADLYLLDVLAIILGNWDGSRLNRKLVKDKRLLYTISSYNYTPRFPGLFIIYGIGDPENISDSKEAILEEIEKIIVSGISKEELEAVKAQVIASYIASFETTGGQAGALSQSKFLTGDALFFERYVKEIEKIDSVALGKIAKKYLRQNSLTTSIIYPTSFTGAPKSSESPRQEKSVPQKHILSGGMRLILMEDHRLPKLSMVCAFMGGLRAETRENNGISNLTSSMLLKGTKKRDESQIREAMENRGGIISSFSGKNTFGIFLEALSGDSANALDIFEDVIKNSVFPEEEIDKQKEKIFALILAEEDDIYNVGFLEMRKDLFGDYPYSMRTLGEKTTVENLTQSDIRDFYEKFCTSQNMVLSIVGDFDSARMLLEIKKRFADMNKNQVDFKWPTPPGQSGVKKTDINLPKEQSLAVIGFRGVSIDDTQRDRLSVLSSVLSGEDGRLYRSVRDALGISYTLGSFSQAHIDTGYFASYAATDKKHLLDVKNILFSEVKKIKTGKISENEIQLSKASLIGKQRISLQSFGAFAYQTALDEIYDLGFDAYLNYAKRISRITRKDVIETAQKYIDFDNFALVTVTGSEGYK